MNLAGESVQEGGPFSPGQASKLPSKCEHVCNNYASAMLPELFNVWDAQQVVFLFLFLSHVTVTETHYRLGINKMLPWFLCAEDVKRVLAGFLLEIVLWVSCPRGTRLNFSLPLIQHLPLAVKNTHYIFPVNFNFFLLIQQRNQTCPLLMRHFVFSCSWTRVPSSMER